MTQCELSCHFLMCIHILSLFLHLSLKAGLNMFSLQGLLKDIHVFTELSTTKFSIHLSLLIHPFLFFHFSPCLQGMTSTCFLGWTFVLPHRSCWKFYSGLKWNATDKIWDFSTTEVVLSMNQSVTPKYSLGWFLWGGLQDIKCAWFSPKGFIIELSQ